MFASLPAALLVLCVPVEPAIAHGNAFLRLIRLLGQLMIRQLAACQNLRPLLASAYKATQHETSHLQESLLPLDFCNQGLIFSGFPTFKLPQPTYSFDPFPAIASHGHTWEFLKIEHPANWYCVVSLALCTIFQTRSFFFQSWSLIRPTASTCLHQWLGMDLSRRLGMTSQIRIERWTANV